MADDDTKDSRGPRSWSRFDARLAALAAVSTGYRSAPADDPMRPFDATAAPGVAASGQPEHPVPPEGAMGPVDATFAAMLAEANSSGNTPPAPGTPSADANDAEGKPAGSADEATASARPSGALPAQAVAADDVRPAETTGDTAQRIEGEVAADKETAQAPRPPATEAQPPRATDVEADLVGLKADVELRPVELKHDAPGLLNVEQAPPSQPSIDAEFGGAYRARVDQRAGRARAPR